MKRIFITFLVLCILISCKKITYNDIGMITGPNMRMCPSICCSGTYIDIDNATYLFESLPTNSGIDLKSSAYPITVELNWKPIAGCSSPQTIEITAIKKR